MQLPILGQRNGHHGGEEMGDIRMVYMHKHQTNPTPTLPQLELMSARAQLATTCTKCGTGNQGQLRICEGCRTVSYCSRRCQKKHWRHHIKDCWFLLGCTDMSGQKRSIGPVRASTPCQVVREAAADWKRVSPLAVGLVHNTQRLLDGHTLGSSGIRKEQDVTVIITPPENWDIFCESFAAWFVGVEMRIPCRCHWCMSWWGRGRTGRAAALLSEMEEVD